MLQRAMTLEELFKQALQLPTKERAKLAGELLESLDDEPDEDVEAAWNAEIERRLQDGDDAYEEITVEELHARLSARIKNKARAT
jgi:putative addiction module component (TIGR02574 family)